MYSAFVCVVVCRHPSCELLPADPSVREMGSLFTLSSFLVLSLLHSSGLDDCLPRGWWVFGSRGCVGRSAIIAVRVFGSAGEYLREIFILTSAVFVSDFCVHLPL